MKDSENIEPAVSIPWDWRLPRCTVEREEALLMIDCTVSLLCSVLSGFPTSDMFPEGLDATCEDVATEWRWWEPWVSQQWWAVISRRSYSQSQWRLIQLRSLYTDSGSLLRLHTTLYDFRTFYCSWNFFLALILFIWFSKYTQWIDGQIYSHLR